MEPLISRKFESLTVEVYPDRPTMGRAAARFVADAMKAHAATVAETRMIFAAAPSQNEMLDALVADSSLDWSRVRGFHMDEYLGLAADHPASFRNFLNKKIFQKVGITPDKLHLIPGE
ncbi:MAG: glucosamine-6-phosphate deaminase, partial [bacterium]